MARLDSSMSALNLLQALCGIPWIGTSASVELPSRSRFFKKMTHDKGYNRFPLNTFLPSYFFWSLDLEIHLLILI